MPSRGVGLPLRSPAEENCPAALGDHHVEICLSTAGQRGGIASWVGTREGCLGEEGGFANGMKRGSRVNRLGVNSVRQVGVRCGPCLVQSS